MTHPFRLRVSAALAALALYLVPLAAQAGPFSNWAAVVVAGDWHAHSGGPTEAFDNARRDVAQELTQLGFAKANIAQFEALLRNATLTTKRAQSLLSTPAGQQSAVDSALAFRPDVAVIDISLPVMDGWEATRRLKADPATRAIPVLALTAHALSTDRDKCFEVGANDYDTKPVDFPRLLGKIEALLAGGGAE